MAKPKISIKNNKAKKSEESPIEEVSASATTSTPEKVLDAAVAKIKAPSVKAAPKRAAPEVSVAPAEQDDYVKVLMSRSIDPAPTVGNFNVAEVLKIKLLKEGETYMVPRNVALVLQDAKAVLFGG